MSILIMHICLLHSDTVVYDVNDPYGSHGNIIRLKQFPKIIPRFYFSNGHAPALYSLFRLVINHGGFE